RPAVAWLPGVRKVDADRRGLDRPGRRTGPDRGLRLEVDLERHRATACLPPVSRALRPSPAPLQRRRAGARCPLRRRAGGWRADDRPGRLAGHGRPQLGLRPRRPLDLAAPSWFGLARSTRLAGLVLVRVRVGPLLTPW